MTPTFVKLGGRFIALTNISSIESCADADEPLGGIVRLVHGKVFYLPRQQWSALLAYMETQTATGLVVDLDRVAAVREAQEKAA